MHNDDFEDWYSFKNLALTNINILSKVEEQPITGNVEEELKRVTQRRQEPEYKEAANRLRDILRDMCKVYLRATPTQRVGIRDLLKGKISLLVHLRGLQLNASEQINSTD